MPIINFTKEQKLIQNEIRRFASTEVEPIAAEMDQQGEIPAAVLEKLSQLGLLGPMVPEKYGGTGLDATSLCIMSEELSKIYGSIGVILVVNNMLCSSAINKYGTEQQKQIFLSRLAKGDIGGYDIGIPIDNRDNLAKVSQINGSLEISGKKRIMLNGDMASFLIIKTDPDQGQALYLVDKDNSSFTAVKRYVIGLKGAGIAEVEFNRAKLQPQFCLADKDKIDIVLEDIGNLFSIGLSAVAIGISAAALDSSIKYSKERKQFGRAICQFPMVQEMLADMKIKLEAARNLVYEAAVTVDAGGNYKLPAEIALASSMESVVYAGIKSVQIYGGYGYTKDYPVERFLRDAKTLQNLKDTIMIKENIARILLS